MLHQHHHFDHHVARPALATINVFGDAIHNFIDGVLIGASYLASPALGVSTTAAVLLHEIPQEFGDFSILLHSGVCTMVRSLKSFCLHLNHHFSIKAAEAF